MHKSLFCVPGTPTNTSILSVHVLDPRTGIDDVVDLRIENGIIVEITSAGSLPTEDAIDGRGLYLFPGFFDPHVHLRTPGQEHKETIRSGTLAAASGGYVGIIAMPNTMPVIDSVAGLRGVIDRAQREAVIPVGFMPAISTGLQGTTLTDMTALREAGALGFTDDGRPVVDSALLRRALQYQKMHGAVLALHEEDPALAADGVVHEGEIAARRGLSAIPALAESVMVVRDAAIAAYEEAAIHIQHVSAKESVAAIREAKQRGVRITAEAAPHHLALTEQALADQLDTSLKMNPPLRESADREALIAGINDGTIDCVATDHAPHAQDEKDIPFEQAPMGTTGLETAFSVLYTHLTKTGELPLNRLIEKMTAGASIVGLKPATIAQGEVANLCLVDLKARWIVGENGYQSRSENSCFAGSELDGQVVLTIAAGAIVYRNALVDSTAVSEVGIA